MKKYFKSPIDLVADALEIDRSLVNENSAMGETLNWDSLNHVVIVGELEKHYEITIPNDKIEEYETMSAIITLYNKKIGNQPLGKRFIKGLKNVPILKIFFK